MDGPRCFYLQNSMINIRERHKVFETSQNLKSNASPLFGIMTPQHMIEHLIFVLKFSNGKLPQQLMVDERLSKTIKHYTIDTEREMSIGFKAPMLGDELIPLLLPDINSAIEQLRKELIDFDLYFEKNPDSKPMSPVLGELDHREWIIFHNKHFTHHFKQFDLL